MVQRAEVMVVVQSVVWEELWEEQLVATAVL